MISFTGPLAALRSVALLSLLGLAVITLIGPALAVAGTLLPFALVGALSYGAYRLVAAGVARLRRRRSPAVLDRPPTPTPVQHLQLVARSQRRCSGLGRMILVVMTEVGAGAALGAALCVLAGWPNGTAAAHPALGAAIGAVVGFVVGGSRPKEEEGEACPVTESSSQAI